MCADTKICTRDLILFSLGSQQSMGMTARKGEVSNHRSEEPEAHGYLGRDPSP